MPKRPRQTAQTQIRLLLKKQSDQGLPCCYSDKNLVNSSLENSHFILEQKEKGVHNFGTLTNYIVLVEYILTFCTKLSYPIWPNKHFAYLFTFENSVDPDQLASDDHNILHSSKEICIHVFRK